MIRKIHRLRKIPLTTPACMLLVACGGGGDDSNSGGNPPPTVSNDAEINFVINAGQGFNDPTSVAPVGGNTGTTLGAQRLEVIKEATRIWSAVLDINTDIVLDVSFTKLQCGSSQGVVGAANPTNVFQQFNDAPLANTWYVSALANNLAGMDLDPDASDKSDIKAEFNSSIGQSGCLDGVDFYYGFDGANRNDQIDLLHIVLHEIGHGLGFISLVNLGQIPGEPLGSLLKENDTGIGRMDAFTTNLRDKNFTRFAQLTDNQRVDSVTSQALWAGEAVTAAIDTLNCCPVETSGGAGVPMHTPTNLDAGSSLSHWADEGNQGERLEPIELMQPNTPEKGLHLLSALDMGSMLDIGWKLREDADQDGDGLPNIWEVINGLDPRIDDSTGDLDGDGLTNAQELSFATAANNADTDGDTLSDSDELNIHNTDPTKADTDGDGTPDNEEV